MNEKKLYKNSICELCRNANNLVKLKENPKTKDLIIICAGCFSKIQKEK